MEQQRTGDPPYVMGRSAAEARRLEQQADFFKPFTRHLFVEAGITTGMTVLDLGSGSGDVALLAAELVGPTGQVVGVDSNPAIVATARERARAAGLAQVTFIASDFRDVALAQDFDAVVGRFVLEYQADPVAALRSALGALRADGLAVFCEFNLPAGVASYPHSPLHQLAGRCVSETYARAGVELEMGWKLYQTFLDAGLPEPQLRTETLIGGGREWMERFAPYAANTLRSLMPLILEYGVATEEEIGIESFEARYREEILSQRGIVQPATMVGAWARKRAAAPEADAQGTQRWSD
jgi:ubiquinone/menaquinone biosynthesis C-methylase UbiE